VLSDLDPALRRAEPARPLRELTNALERDIEDFKRREGVDRVVLLDLSSTAKASGEGEALRSLASLEAALDAPYEQVAGQLSEGMLYAYAALKQGCPCANFTPSTTFDTPALLELAAQQGLPLCGKDGKTGQTLYKTALAPMFKQRGLRVKGWYSTNILGNRDGEVLNHPEHRQTKIDSKRAALTDILGYDDLDHQVHIHYYKPRGDAKEAWDNIDLEGWFGVQMQMKVNWLGWDSILAAPLAADLVRWLVFYHAQGVSGPLPQLASYFKSPLGGAGHDLFEQRDTLKNDVLSRLKEPPLKNATRTGSL
jgi:myo-inositol-1-phosphate synthase